MRYIPATKSFDRSVRFSRGYKGGRKSSDVNSGPLTEAYRRGCAAMGPQWDKMQQYCPNCGLLPSWCECSPEDRTVAAAMANIDRAPMGPNDYAFYPGDRDDRAEPGERSKEQNG